MINNLEAFLKEANLLLAALTEYSEATDRLYDTAFFNLPKVDLQQNQGGATIDDLLFAVDDIEGIIQEREEIKERAEFARIAMTRAIDEQGDEDTQLINCVFMGEAGKEQDISYSLSGDRSLAKEVIYKLLAVQKDIIEKDGEIIANLSSKQDEIKSSLKNLQEHKKKLDFLNVTATGQQDSGFNV